MRNKSNQNASGAQLNLPQRVSRDSLRLDVPSSPSVPSSSSTTTSSLSSSARFSLPRSPANYSDRFIPSRRASNFEAFSLPDTETTRALSANNSSTGNSHSNVSSNGSDGREDSSAAYIALMRSELFPALSSWKGSSEKSFEASLSPSSLKSPFSSPVGNVLKFRSSPGACAQKPPSPYAVSPIGSRDDLCDSWLLPRKSSRKISRSPFKVLDAPALQDDFYLNLVDWSCHNILAVGLGSCVYLWSASSSKVTKLCDLGPDDSVSSVAWTQRGTYLAVGTNIGDVQIWDATHCKKVRSLTGHRTRAGTLAWNSHILSSGSRDRSILQRDVRSQDDFVSKFSGHKSEVCGLKWSYDDRELASGGNDNQLFVWNQQSSQPVLKFSEHTAAVKAIAWSPHQHGLLASGGGTADRCIRFWNTTTNTSLNSVDTGSQVCNLVWSKNVNEIVSTHGYSQNQIIVWRYPSMSKLATLTGHTLRVLYLAISPDGQTIVTGAGDETLRFWNVFPSSKAQSAIQDTGVWSSGRTYIR